MKTFTECINDSFTVCDYALVIYVRYKHIYVPEGKPNTKFRLKVLHHPFLLLLKTSYLYVSENKDGCVTDVDNPLLALIQQKNN